MVFVENGPSMTLIPASPKAPLAAPEKMHIGAMDLAPPEAFAPRNEGRHPDRLDNGTSQTQGKTVDYKMPISSKVPPIPPFNHTAISPGPVSGFKGQIQYESGDIPPLMYKATLPPVNLPRRAKDQDLRPEECAARLVSQRPQS